MTAILCGGRGMRAYPHTETVPKPLLEVGDRPVLRHVMDIYAGQGHTDFVLAAGYLADAIERFAQTLPRTWSVEVVDTGEDTGTGARLAACRDLLGERFFATYGDGLGDVDLDGLVDHHQRSGLEATLTAVPMRSPFGALEVDGADRVRSFREKPVIEGYYLNAGFMVLESVSFDRWAGDDLERDVLPDLARAATLGAYRHDGFWASMDTYKDALELTELCRGGDPPWLRAGSS